VTARPGSAATIRVTGLKQNVRALKTYAEELPAEVKALNQEAAKLVAREGVRRAPVGDTGNLARSVRMSSTPTKATVLAGSNAVVPYAGVIHFGWPDHNIEPQPFLYEALDARRREVMEMFDLRIKAISERVGARTL
jgi:phage gpG-like protein